MRLENSFEIPVAPDEVWSYLVDVEKIVTCMPGAQLTEMIDDRNWKGKVEVKVGPVKFEFAGKVIMQERDDDAHRVVLEATAIEQRGKGSASAMITSALESVAEQARTRVVIVQDLNIQGQVAQTSRGMLPDVTARLTTQFAECLEANLLAQERAAPGEQPEYVEAGEIRGLSLGLAAIWASIKRFFRKLSAK